MFVELRDLILASRYIFDKKNPGRLADQAGAGSMTEENLKYWKLFLITMTSKILKSFIRLKLKTLNFSLIRVLPIPLLLDPPKGRLVL